MAKLEVVGLLLGTGVFDGSFCAMESTIDGFVDENSGTVVSCEPLSG